MLVLHDDNDDIMSNRNKEAAICYLLVCIQNNSNLIKYLTLKWVGASKYMSFVIVLK